MNKNIYFYNKIEYGEFCLNNIFFSGEGVIYKCMYIQLVSDLLKVKWLRLYGLRSIKQKYTKTQIIRRTEVEVDFKI